VLPGGAGYWLPGFKSSFHPAGVSTLGLNREVAELADAGSWQISTH